MMNYIGADGFFINLAAIVSVEDTTDEATGDEVPVSRCTVTTIGGVDITFEGEDADNILDRIGLIALETEATRRQMSALIAQAEGAQTT